MTWILLLIPLMIVAVHLGQLYAKGDIPGMMRSLRYIVGGGLLAAAAILAIGRRIGLASMLVFFATSVLLRGRLGPIDFNSVAAPRGAKSKVRSTFFEMQMDHDSGAVEGKVTTGNLAGRDLMSIDEQETRDLLNEVTSDPDSLSLLETWLDVNRSGWREHLGYQTDSEQSQSKPAANDTQMDAQQAYEILGVEPDATESDIKAAHRRLLKAVHPDQGGSNFLAARINAAKDFLLSQK